MMKVLRVRTWFLYGYKQTNYNAVYNTSLYNDMHSDHCYSTPLPSLHGSIPTDVLQFMGDAPLKNRTQSDCLSQILLVSALANSLSIRLCYYSFMFCLCGSPCLMDLKIMSLLCSVGERKGAAERWNLLPSHQANHQQRNQVSVCYLLEVFGNNKLSSLIN